MVARYLLVLPNDVIHKSIHHFMKNNLVTSRPCVPDGWRRNVAVITQLSAARSRHLQLTICIGLRREIRTQPRHCAEQETDQTNNNCDPLFRHFHLQTTFILQLQGLTINRKVIKRRSHDYLQIRPLLKFRRNQCSAPIEIQVIQAANPIQNSWHDCKPEFYDLP